jgi:hypothetical protein
MTIAAGLFKQVAYKIESAFGAAPGQTLGQLLRRVKSTVDLSKDTFTSNEIRPDFQTANPRHGVRRVTGKIDGELSCKTYADLFGLALKRDFTAGVSASAVSLTIAGTGPSYTVGRAAGSYLTDGFKVGSVTRLSVGALNAANLNKNLLITALTGPSMTVLALNGSPLVAEGPVTGCTVTEFGKVTWVPQTGHTDKSMAIEHWYTDIAQSELFLGNKIDKIALALPPTGMATVSFDVVGQDMADTLAKRGAVATTTQYFTSPTAVTTTGALAAVNGIVRMGGATVATLTGLTLEIDPSFKGDPVVGSNTVPVLAPGLIKVSGQATVYFDSVTLRDAFINETEIDLYAIFTADNTAASDFIAISLPLIKPLSSSKDDGDGPLVQTFAFQAEMNAAGGAGIATEKTTIRWQDSQA